MKRRSLGRAQAPAALAVVLLGYGIAGCSAERSTSARSQAGPASSVQSIELEAVPLYPRSDPVGPRRQHGQSVEQTFAVLGATPGEVLDWYAGQLSHWIALPVEATDRAASLQRTWVAGARRLVVAAAPSTEVGADSPYTIEYSLTLEDREAARLVPDGGGPGR